MKKTFLLISLVVILVSCKDKSTEPTLNQDVVDGNDNNQKAEIDRTYRPLLHLFTSTDCGGCGRFGIPVFSTVADEMGDTIFALPTHFKYKDPFINETSLAIEKAVVKHYASPQIWVNDEEITYQIISYPLSTAIEKTKNFLRDQLDHQPEAYVGMNAKLQNNGRYKIDVSVETTVKPEGKLRYEVYMIQDGAIASQAGSDPYVTPHERVNRGGYYGEMGKIIESEADSVNTDSFEFIPCGNCAPVDDLYFFVVVWKEVSDGRFEYVNGKVVPGGK